MSTIDQQQHGENSPVPEGALVVGIDGSDRDETCIRYAAGAAERTGRPLHLLHAQDIAVELAAANPIAARGLAFVPDLVLDSGVLAEALEQARSQWPDLEISGSEPWMHPEEALIDASENAYMIVVGASRISGLERLLLGRSALAVSLHASCPVVIMPEGGRTDPDGPVVLGFDGSEGARAAARRALWIANLRGTSVRVVTSWYAEVVEGAVVTTPGTPAWEQVERRFRTMVEEGIADLRAEYPDVEVDIRVVRGPAAEVLTKQAADASMLVIGSRGRGGFRSMLLGSVSHKVIETASSPVMVIRDKKQAR
ncbi:MAG: universal stress protein [Actinomycetia bacterium]|nr:universal stress protein [Actinomycetes bacterium]